MSKILLAEDEEVLRMLVVDTLEDEGYSIDEACDGQEAYDLIKQNEYDLILLDYMMPVYTGLELIELIRKENIQTKIMMLSAKSQATDQQKVLEAGANYFMSKPFSPIQLVERIEEILGEAR
ncbi:MULTISPECIES: response regulator transcription factor [Metabacillus]|uniref:response regulator transcription factor n=1 Tax=Metabacillus TaxID=2675233 RepID=UPI000EF5FC8C|nr:MULTISPECIES: response regulator [Metabacillus]MCM3161097.1 response regulator [Metabacillus litoralis]MCM3412928.1 response regulator [Metabacillus litoralis]UGB30036.1 response regulator [Metabacillus sp. B2-18]UHA62014.1 response regulator [Metabacillus litoralis]